MKLKTIRGWYVTDDGLCFNTADKAWAHARELAAAQTKNQKDTENGKNE